MTVITSKSFKSFVLELKRLEKAGEAKIVSTSFRNGFFGAVVDKGVDSAYQHKLSQLTGDEFENTADTVDYLGGNWTMKEPERIELSEKVFDKLHQIIQESETEGEVVVPTKRRRSRKVNKEVKH